MRVVQVALGALNLIEHGVEGVVQSAQLILRRFGDAERIVAFAADAFSGFGQPHDRPGNDPLQQRGKRYRRSQRDHHHDRHDPHVLLPLLVQIGQRGANVDVALDLPFIHQALRDFQAVADEPQRCHRGLAWRCELRILAVVFGKGLLLRVVNAGRFHKRLHPQRLQSLPGRLPIVIVDCGGARGPHHRAIPCRLRTFAS